MRHEAVCLVMRCIGIVRHEIECAAVIHGRVVVGSVPPAAKTNNSIPASSRPPCPSGTYNRMAGIHAGVGAGAVNPPIDRRSQAEEIRADIMMAHRAKRGMRFACGPLNVALAPGVGDALVGFQCRANCCKAWSGWVRGTSADAADAINADEYANARKIFDISYSRLTLSEGP